jgi:peptide deformylase
MEIVKYCHPALRHKSTPLTEISDEFKATVRTMFELMYEARGIGLAANQVALPFRFFIANPTADPEEKDQEMVFINPEIIRKKGNVDGEEGCLSIPEVYGQVPRAEEIVVEAYDLDGEGFELTTDDLLARVIQHESDHLDGVMFFDRMRDSDREEIDSKIKDFEAAFRKKQAAGECPADDQIKAQLQEIEQSFAFPE